MSVTKVVSRRVIAATAELIFDAWLDPKSLAKWMLPTGTLRSTAKTDPRPGGKYEIDMETSEGSVLHTGAYLVIERPRRLVFTWVSPLSMSVPGARLAGVGFLGNGVAFAAVEAFSRILAGEVGSAGIRTICLRSDAIPEALPESHTQEVFESVAKKVGATGGAQALLAERARSATLLGRLTTLQQVAEYAAFVASDSAGATTGAIANLTAASLVD